MRHEQGFTLVELMVSVLLAGIALYACFTVFSASGQHIEGSNVKMTIEDSAREGLYKMIQEIRLSSPSQVTLLNGGTSIQFKVPDPNNPLGSDYRVDWAAAHLITYSLGGTNNRQIIRADSSTNETKVVANDVTALNFTGNATPPSLITVTMSVQKSMVNGRQMTSAPLQVSARAELRNP